MFEKIPSIHFTIQALSKIFPDISDVYLKRFVQKEVELLRDDPKKYNLQKLTKKEFESEFIDHLKKNFKLLVSGSLSRVINASGIVLHTNLGRAPLDESLIENLKQVSRYTNLEYNLKTGRRGQRNDHLSDLLRLLSGADGGFAVNNNAAAVMLMLNTVGRGKEVLLSRGEMVEIGGSFRMPEVMKMSGCKLKDVGATNKTHLSDYADAISPKTAAILICHTSNYSIQGFTAKPALDELVRLASDHQIPLIYDLGSGAFETLHFDLKGEEPLVSEIVAAGVDLVSFSGDKLLGGPQAGLIVGKKQWIQKCAKNHLLRALRLDKLMVAVLQETLIRHLSGASTIEAQVMLNQSDQDIKKRSKALISKLPEPVRKQLQVVPELGKVGSGAYPVQKLPSFAIRVYSSKISTAQIARRLRQNNPPVIGYIYDDIFHLDLRAVSIEEETDLAKAIEQILSN